MSNAKEIYEKRLAEMKKNIANSAINTELEIKQIANEKFDDMVKTMQKVTGTEVWRDFNWKTGKILGVLRFIVQNPIKRKQLLEITGLTEDYIDMYIKVCGNLPYVSATDNTINKGRPMQIEATKEFIQVVASKWGLIVEDDDLSDITEERWNNRYKAALERAETTVNFNNESGATTETQYEE